MKGFLKGALLTAAGVAGVCALSFAATGANLASLNFWGPKYEDARRNIEQHSIRRQEGVSEGIGALCLNMRTAKDEAGKNAFADMIVMQGTAAGTQLTPQADACLIEAQRQLGV